MAHCSVVMPSKAHAATHGTALVAASGGGLHPRHCYSNHDKETHSFGKLNVPVCDDVTIGKQ